MPSNKLQLLTILTKLTIPGAKTLILLVANPFLWLAYNTWNYNTNTTSDHSFPLIVHTDNYNTTTTHVQMPNQNTSHIVDIIGYCFTR